MITKFGKRFITNYLAGNINFSNKDIALGIGTTAVNANGNDTRLEFEFYRLPASFGSIDIQTNDTGSPIVARDGVTTIPAYSSIYYVIYKATIPQDIAGVISEIGLYPGTRTSINNYDSKFITSFENNLGWTDGTYSPSIKYNSTSPIFTARIGESMVQYDVSANSVKEYKANISILDISGYSNNDTLTLAYKKADNNVSKIRVKLYSSDTQYCYVDFTPTSGTGDKIQSISLATLFGNISATAPDLTTISQVGVEVTAGSGGATTVYFDGIRINDEDTFDPTFGLISRSVLSTPLQKASGRQVDIEYKIKLGF
jgi:hypothetical protein